MLEESRRDGEGGSGEEMDGWLQETLPFGSREVEDYHEVPVHHIGHC